MGLFTGQFLYFEKCPKNILFATHLEFMLLLSLLVIIIYVSSHLPYYPRIYIGIAVVIFTVLSASETWGIVNSWVCLLVSFCILKFLLLGTVTVLMVLYWYEDIFISIDFW